MTVFTAVVERCSDTGLYVGYVPGFPGAHSQGETMDELRENLRGRSDAARGRPPEIGGGICRDTDRGGSLTVAKLPVLKPREVVKRLTEHGFYSSARNYAGRAGLIEVITDWE